MAKILLHTQKAEGQTTLDQKAIDKLNEFIKEYREIGLNLDLMQKSIEGLAEKRDRLLDRVEELKLEERTFIKELSSKYGDSEITPNKLMQYVES